MLYTVEEHKSKKLITGEIQETTTILNKIKESDVEVLRESAKGKSGRKLIVQMEAIHVGKTQNNTFYTEEGLRSGLSSWTQPYNKPVLTHHNTYNGEAIGRILKAEYSEHNISGKSGLLFTVEITDPVAIEKVLDGRYQTVSIGATTDKVTCNICGTDRTEEWCDHYPGETYEDQECHFIIGKTIGREVSYVNTPSDIYAGNVSVRVEDEKDSKDTSESVEKTYKVFQVAEGLYQDAESPDVNIYEHLNEDVKKMLDAISIVKDEGDNSMDKSKKVVDEGVEEILEETEKAPEKIETKETSESSLQEMLNQVLSENIKLKASLKEKEDENQNLLAENAKLLKEAHAALVEKIVDLKQSLGKADVALIDRDEAIAEHAKRTEESLMDTLNDLMAEKKAAQTVIPGSVENPGRSEAVTEEEDKEKSKGISLEEGVKVLTNMFNRTR